MSNSILTDSVIVKECLMELKNQIGFSKNVSRQYDDRFANEGAKIGDTINIRKPARYSVTDGAVLNVQDSVDESVALQLDTQRHVGMGFSSKDLTLSVDAFKERYVKPAVTSLANDLDYTGFSAMYKKVNSYVGVPSATALPSNLKGFTQAYAKLANNGASLDDLTALIDPNVQASLVEGLKSLFQSSEQIKKQYEKGVMGEAAGMKFVMSQNVSKHTSGAVAGAAAIDTTVTANGTATLHIDGLTGVIATVYTKGDIITIDSVYAVNPQTKQSTGELMQFVVTADTGTSTSGEIASLPIYPAIYLSGAKQNVNRAPTDADVVKLFGHATSYAGVIAPQNLVFHKDAFALGCADLVLPKGMHMAAKASDKESGLSVRLISGYDIVNDRMNSRLDILFGWLAMYPEFACRVVGQPA